MEDELDMWEYTLPITPSYIIERVISQLLTPLITHTMRSNPIDTEHVEGRDEMIK